MNEPKQIDQWKKAMQRGTRPRAERADCLDSDSLAQMIADPLAAPESSLAHVERCSACAEELRSMGDLPELETMVRQMAPRRRISRWIPMAAAACLVVAVGLGSFLILDERPETVTRGLPANADITPRDGAVLERAPVAMTWSARDDQRYRVILYDAQAVRLWAGEPVEAGRVELPEAVRESLEPSVYYWQLQIVETGTLQGPYAFEVRTTDEH